VRFGPTTEDELLTHERDYTNWYPDWQEFAWLLVRMPDVLSRERVPHGHFHSPEEILQCRDLAGTFRLTPEQEVAAIERAKRIVEARSKRWDVA
jgi:hypothetical protein